MPLDRAVEDVARLPVLWRRLWTHEVGHDDGVAASPGNLVDARDVPQLDAYAAGLAALLEVRVVPPRGTGHVVAGACQQNGSRLDGTQVRTDRLAVRLAHAAHNQLLDT